VPWNHWDLAKAIAFVMIGSLIAGGIAVVAADSLLDPGQEYEDNPSALTIILLASLVAQELLLLGALVWFTARKYGAAWATLGLRKPDRMPWWFPGALTLAALGVIYGWVAMMSLVGWTEDDMPAQAFDNAGPLIVVVVAAVFMAPVIEELFFRGFLFGGLQEGWGWVLAAAVSSILFGMAHLSPYALVPFTLVGFLFAWSFRYTGSLASSIVAHTIVNTVSVAILFAG
jgi:membrane protease YdiL (CAAX protease family)